MDERLRFGARLPDGEKSSGARAPAHGLEPALGVGVQRRLGRKKDATTGRERAIAGRVLVTENKGRCSD
jgi:hypothetical protein